MDYKEFKIQYALGTLDENFLYELSIISKDKRILTILSKDKDYIVRGNVASNINTPIKILTILSKDSYLFVKDNVTQNANIPIRILEKLCADADYLVSCNARSRLVFRRKHDS